ncbi:hypothetical protein B0T16DRAFT_423522, partial [Cercophora newfieldiana]
MDHLSSLQVGWWGLVEPPLGAVRLVCVDHPCGCSTPRLNNAESTVPLPSLMKSSSSILQRIHIEALNRGCQHDSNISLIFVNLQEQPAINAICICCRASDAARFTDFRDDRSRTRCSIRIEARLRISCTKPQLHSGGQCGCAWLVRCGTDKLSAPLAPGGWSNAELDVGFSMLRLCGFQVFGGRFLWWGVFLHAVRANSTLDESASITSWPRGYSCRSFPRKRSLLRPLLQSYKTHRRSGHPAIARSPQLRRGRSGTARVATVCRCNVEIPHLNNSCRECAMPGLVKTSGLWGRQSAAGRRCAVHTAPRATCAAAHSALSE